MLEVSELSSDEKLGNYDSGSDSCISESEDSVSSMINKRSFQVYFHNLIVIKTNQYATTLIDTHKDKLKP